MIKSDRWIIQAARDGMIRPFIPSLVRAVPNKMNGANLPHLANPANSGPSYPVISYGTGSFGYDLRLSAKDFRIFHRRPGHVVDPKRFAPDDLTKSTLHHGENDERYFILPGNSYGLGVAVEYLDVPRNISILCLGKSTYARCGIIANLTPAEAGWKGHLTLEFSNASQADCRIYADEGCVQLLFFAGDDCQTSYHDRKGKYQDQLEQVTLPKV